MELPLFLPMKGSEPVCHCIHNYPGLTTLRSSVCACQNILPTFSGEMGGEFRLHRLDTLLYIHAPGSDSIVCVYAP